MRKKGQNGFVIELMIVFMLVTFAFCLVVTTYAASLSAERKLSNAEINQQASLNQIGEYYMRCVEAGGVFPQGSAASYDYKSFSWMDDGDDKALTADDETVKFFTSHKDYEYTEELKYSHDDLANFFREKGVYRRLTVKSGGKNKMVITVFEQFTSQTSSDCEIVTWHTGDNVEVEQDEGFQEVKDINDLQKAINKFWKFFNKLDKIVKDDSYDGNLLKRAVAKGTDALKAVIDLNKGFKDEGITFWTINTPSNIIDLGEDILLDLFNI